MSSTTSSGWCSRPWWSSSHLRSMDQRSLSSPDEDLAPRVERQTLRLLGSMLPRSVRARQIHEWQDQLDCTRATNGDPRHELLQLVRSTPSIAWTVHWRGVSRCVRAVRQLAPASVRAPVLGRLAMILLSIIVLVGVSPQSDLDSMPKRSRPTPAAQRAAIALKLTGVAGGGYVAVQELPDRRPARGSGARRAAADRRSRRAAPAPQRR
jgi:hypothetical protein